MRPRPSWRPGRIATSPRQGGAGGARTHPAPAPRQHQRPGRAEDAPVRSIKVPCAPIRPQVATHRRGRRPAAAAPPGAGGPPPARYFRSGLTTSLILSDVSPTASFTLPLALSTLPSRLSESSPVGAPPASLMRPLASSPAPSPIIGSFGRGQAGLTRNAAPPCPARRSDHEPVAHRVLGDHPRLHELQQVAGTAGLGA